MFQFTTKALYSTALALLLASSDAAAIPGLQKKAEKVYQLGFSVQEKTAPLPASSNTTIEGAAKPYEYTVYQDKYSYVADIYVGSNSQKASVIVDTGSSDLWFIDSASGISTDDGTYDHTSSSSYKDIGSGFFVLYGDRSYAYGDWVSDTVALSELGPSVDNLQFGDATTVSKISQGILGIGKKALEAASTKYDNFPIALKNSGAIDTVAYSLYLDSSDATSGNVLFGGIDQAKYSGDLVTLPIDDDTYLSVEVTGFTYNGNTISVGQSTLLDSGTTYTYFPSDIINSLASALGATTQDGGYVGWATYDEIPTFIVNFNGLDIQLSKDAVGGKITFTNGQESAGYALLFQSRESANLDENILGENFLRDVYAVYNFDANTISLAQVKYTTEENIVSI